MMNVRQRVFMIVGIIAGLVVAIILGVHFWKSRPVSPEQQTGATNDTTANTGGNATTGGNTGAAPNFPSRPPEEIYPLQLAKLFVERFGTYSNQNGNGHIDDVLPLSTGEMQRWLETQRVAASTTYTGQTTVVVASSITSQTATAAEIHVDVQQHVDGVEDETMYRSGRVTLVFEQNAWKVSGLYWDKQ